MKTTRRTAPRAHNLPHKSRTAPRHAHHCAPHADLLEIRIRASVVMLAGVLGMVASVCYAFA